MQLQNEIRKSIGPDGDKATFTLRQPTNEELNEFLAARYQTSRHGRMRDNSIAARVAFFDTLLVGVENLTDCLGNPVTPETKQLIPTIWKTAIVFSEFENVEIDEELEKN